MDWEFEPVAGPFKGPVAGLAWDGETLLFSVPWEDRILRYDPRDGRVSLFRKYTLRTNGLAFSPEGHLYGCQAGARRLVKFNADGSASPMQQRLEGRIHNYPNAAVCDSQGRVWFTDPHSAIPTLGPQMHPPLEHASVLRLFKSFDYWYLSRLTFDTRAPRGLALSLDERTLYVSESSQEAAGVRDLRAYPVRDDGSLGQPAVLATFGADHRGIHRGIQGMCLDEEGNIVACGGWSRSGPGPLVYVFAPSGRVLESHPVPAAMPVTCSFGDAGLDTLYVGAGEGATSGEGRLFRVRNTGRRGWAPYPTNP